MTTLTMTRFIATAAALCSLLAIAPQALANAVVLADWQFNETAGTTLNNTANVGTGVGGPGGSWDVNATGVATNGTGELRIRNNGAGGSGTRTTYAKLGPTGFETVSSGQVNLLARFSAWNLSGAGAAGPAFSLALIEGNDFTTAQFTLAASASGLTLSGGVDPYGDGTDILDTAALPAQASDALTVRLSIDLDQLSYELAYDLGSGYTRIGSGQLDSATLGVNSLRMSFNGDYTLSNPSGSSFLALDRVWVQVSEPTTAALVLLAGCGLAVASRRRLVHPPVTAVAPVAALPEPCPRF